MVNVRRFASGTALLAHAEAWLTRAEAENNLILGLAARNATYSDAPASWLAIEDAHDGAIVGVAIQTPPYSLLVTRLPSDAVDPLLDAVESHGVPIPGANGPTETVRALGDAWCARRGVKAHVQFEQRVYELTTVVPPPAVTGRMRVATVADRTLLLEWTLGFHRDAKLSASAATRIERDLDQRLADRHHYLLEDDSGAIVSMASVVGFTPRGARIGGVYTPADLRGRGHASTLVASVSQRLLDEGRAFCFLYTDLANPTSNAIYQRIGYRPVSDALVIAFV